jgi:predicted phage baseplate assembly protein
VEFDFLPNLPKSNLDDRAYKDLVEECILRIPRYCPEWTNYNPSDPGITLIELFAWLTDQMLLRFNQVPRRNYVAFLELLGIRLNPPAPARVDVTFYLSASLPSPYVIEAGTEVATERMTDQEAVVFTTDRHLVIGSPQVLHLLKASSAETTPTALENLFNRSWSLEDGAWCSREQTNVFGDRPTPGNCFYLVFDGAEPLDGNVLSVNFKGEAATTTGINPSMPPRRWEAWNGLYWESVLYQESDDGTRGFSFSDLTRKGYDLSEGADITLHSPVIWPSAQFLAYEGRWLRCVYVEPGDWQPGYLYSPRITGISARSLGGTISASHCFIVRDESLGSSTGKPGQAFQLRERPILERQPEEYIEVTPSNALPQQWREVKDFSNSGSEDLHYVIDSLTGIVQFGPLIRESTQLKQQTQWRSRDQFSTRSRGEGYREDAASWVSMSGELNPRDLLERQYGKVPPRGSEIRMVEYRSGGGAQGNVQSGNVTILRASIPYVQSVVNHHSAQGGTDAESLNEAALRVPQILRTRDRAVTPEDFEVLAIEAGRGKIAKAYCISSHDSKEVGKIRLLLIPQVDPISMASKGLNPEAQLVLDHPLRQQVANFLDERKLLGVQILLQEPEYIRVSIQTEISLEPQYNHVNAQVEVLAQVRQALYRFLNPLTGGIDGKGWPLGQALHSSDVIAVCQKVMGIRYLGIVRLFELRLQGTQWVRFPAQEASIDPGSTGLISSWEDESFPGLGHNITLM